MRTTTMFVAAFLAAQCALCAQAQDLYQAQHGPNGTWNLYELGEIDLTWAEALEEAQSMTRMGVQGDLASIHSVEENSAVHFVGGSQSVWIGLTDREGAAPMLDQNGAISPQESGALNCCGPAVRKLQGWAWTSGEAFNYQNWNGGEPNGGDGEDAAHLWPGGDWNDGASGYFEDEPEEAILEPGTSTDESGGGPLPFVIEYRTESMQPFADIDVVPEQPMREIPDGAIFRGVDTILAEGEDALLGPDGAHGLERDWEWDGSDGGGQNQGLLWFDIPEGTLERLGNGSATLRFKVSNDGDSGDVHRVTVDWLSGPDGGNNVTWNNFPDGPGLFPGDNVEEDPSFFTDPLPVGEYDFDVTEDVKAWAEGAPNYGWGFLPTGGGGTGVKAFESGDGPLLILDLEFGGVAGDFDGDGSLDVDDINLLNAEVANGANGAIFDVSGDGVVNAADIDLWVTELKQTWFGDANLDGEFNSSDIVAVFSGGKFETGEVATWDQGDWNGDLRFGSGDLVVAFQGGGFELGPREAVAAVPEPSSILLISLAVFTISAGLRRREW